jgi:hypothetical protein
MTEPIDMWGTVKKMRELFGARASMVAAKRAEYALNEGDMERSKRWADISKVVSSNPLESAQR